MLRQKNQFKNAEDQTRSYRAVESVTGPGGPSPFCEDIYELVLQDNYKATFFIDNNKSHP